MQNTYAVISVRPLLMDVIRRKNQGSSVDLGARGTLPTTALARRTGSFRYPLQIKPRGGYARFISHKEDLVTIAENMAVLSRASTSGSFYITYTVQEGDKCTAIANRYATTIGTLIRLN